MSIRFTRAINPDHRKTHNDLFWRRPTVMSQIVGLVAFAALAVGLYVRVQYSVDRLYVLVFFVLLAAFARLTGALRAAEIHVGEFIVKRDPRVHKIYRQVILNRNLGYVRLVLIFALFLAPLPPLPRLMLYGVTIALIAGTILIEAMRDSACAALVDGKG